MLMMRDLRTAYCHRFDQYVGKRDVGDRIDAAFDNKTRANAVVRNLKIVRRPNLHHWFGVVTDRFYRLVLLTVELFKMDVYVTGTIMTNRLGYNNNVKKSSQTRPVNIPLGTLLSPARKPFSPWSLSTSGILCTGTVVMESSIGRNANISVHCPNITLNGRDDHGNALRSHKEVARMAGTPDMKRGNGSNQRFQAFAGVVAAPPLTTSITQTHAPEQNEDWVTVSGLQKHRQWSCKVCALLRTVSSKTSCTTTYFCGAPVPDPVTKLAREKTQREFQLRADNGSEGGNEKGSDDE
ncbi:Hypothetical protein PHPALM_11935 [Phytophthora palmivora]|uniref:PiggyBac transposable element-derived protein domain-containing protein n=1 Tax=Phytophthora palmivora TaxID=4796 RepID=A0A2P4Y102_9STRA|nr:Hypothetical protein PHPALM_11935 [Phytophthora palmivora]